MPNYKQMVTNLFSTSGMHNEHDDVMHAAIGISGEAGEILDAIKKAWAYGKPINMDNVVEELGDLEFYMEALRQRLGIDREFILMQNTSKLMKRYPNGVFSAADAIARADKND